MTLINNISTNVTVDILSEFLDIKSLCKLDTSICNKYDRPKLLNYYKYDGFIVQNNNWYLSKYLAWVEFKQIKINILFISANNLQIEKLQFTLYKIRTIKCTCDYTDLNILELVNKCPQLSSLTISCSYTSKITDLSLVNLSYKCLKLTSINIDCSINKKITDYGIISLANNCHQLTSFSIRCLLNDKITKESIKYLVANCFQLTSLTINGMNQSCKVV